MVKQIYQCPSEGCLELFPSKSMANRHHKDSCGIHKKLRSYRANGSPLFRRPQRIDVPMLLFDFCMESIGKGGYGQIFPTKLGKLDLVAKHIQQEKSLQNEMFVYEKFWELSEIPDGIPRYYGLLDKEDYKFIVLERLDFSFDDLTKQNGFEFFEEQDRIKLLMDLTKILKDLHTQIKFAHRDIKQNNVMFKDGLVYLIDFGLAQELPTDSSPLERNGVGNMYLLDIRGHRNHWQDMTADLQTVAFMIADLYFPEGLPWAHYVKDFRKKNLSYEDANTLIRESKEFFIEHGHPKIPKYLNEYLKAVSNKLFGFRVDHGKLIEDLKEILIKLPPKSPCWKGVIIPPRLPKEVFENLNSVSNSKSLGTSEK